MSDLSGLNNLFGSITSKGGRQINFRSVDSNRDGVISQTEFNQAKNRYNVTVDFAFLDSDNNGKISEEEFEKLQQNKDLQTVVNSLKGQISSDFTGIDSTMIPTVIDEIKGFAIDFAELNSGLDDMVEIFRTELQTFYEDLKNSEEFANRPSKILSRSLDKAYAEIKAGLEDRLDEKLSRIIFNKLETVGEAYVKANVDNLSEEELINYLITYMNTSDAEKMDDSAKELFEKFDSYGEMIDKYELKDLKNDVKAFLTDAVNQGIVIKLKGVTIRTTAAIDSALAKFSDGNELRAALKEVIDNLSDTKKIEEMISAYEEDLKVAAEEERRQQELAKQEEINNCVAEIEQYENEIETVVQVEIASIDEDAKESLSTIEMILNNKTFSHKYGYILYPAREQYEEAKADFDKKKENTQKIKTLLNKAKNTSDPEEAKKCRDEAKGLCDDFMKAYDSLKNADRALSKAIKTVKQLMQNKNEISNENIYLVLTKYEVMADVAASKYEDDGLDLMM